MTTDSETCSSPIPTAHDDIHRGIPKTTQHGTHMRVRPPGTLSRRFYLPVDPRPPLRPVLSELRRAPAGVMSTLLTPMLPLAHYACRAYAMTTPGGDRRICTTPRWKAC